MDRRQLARTAAASLIGLAALLLSAPAAAQSKVVWKASDVHPLGYPTVEAIMRMGKKLEAATNGRISIQMYPSMQLGGEKEMIEQAQVGALQIARISVGAMGPVVDDLNVFNLPFIFRDENHMRKVIDGPIGAELLDKINSNPASRIVALGWMDAGVRNVYGKKPATTHFPSLVFEDSTTGKPNPVECKANLPGDIYLSAQLPAVAQAKLVR